jgi:putative membrane protein insertion efficiency factor
MMQSQTQLKNYQSNIKNNFIVHLLKGTILFLINAYRQFFSSFFGMGGNCRFHPSCSQYAKDCFETLPLNNAVQLTTVRLLKCRPFGSSGYDPAPKGAHHE